MSSALAEVAAEERAYEHQRREQDIRQEALRCACRLYSGGGIDAELWLWSTAREFERYITDGTRPKPRSIP